jgi:hypothetical protein
MKVIKGVGSRMEHPQPTLDSLAETDRLLAPNIVPVIEAIRAANQSTVDPATLPLAEARARYEDVQRGWRPTLPSDVAIERFSIPCAPSDLSAVRIVPARAKELVGQMLICTAADGCSDRSILIFLPWLTSPREPDWKLLESTIGLLPNFPFLML